jgi:MFS family permease
VLCDRFGARRLTVPGPLAQAGGFGWLVHLASAGSPYGSYIAPMLVAGVGVSAALPSLPSAALNAVPVQALGQASGVLNTAQRLGATIGIAIATVVFNARGSLTSPAAFTSGYRPAVAVAAGFAALAAITALALRRPAQGQRPDRSGAQPSR